MHQNYVRAQFQLCITTWGACMPLASLFKTAGIGALPSQATAWSLSLIPRVTFAILHCYPAVQKFNMQWSCLAVGVGFESQNLPWHKNEIYSINQDMTIVFQEKNRTTVATAPTKFKHWSSWALQQFSCLPKSKKTVDDFVADKFWALSCNSLRNQGKHKQAEQNQNFERLHLSDSRKLHETAWRYPTSEKTR